MAAVNPSSAEQTRPVLDFDEGQRWLPSLHSHLVDLLPPDASARLSQSEPEGPVSARFALYGLTEKRALIDAVRGWVLARDVLIYHGTRINKAQAASIVREGLRPLVPNDRAAAIEEFLSDHPRWLELRAHVQEAIDFVRQQAGSREGMVYALLSRSGLVRGCNHYLVEGSEFDHHVANYLLGSTCHEENRRRGQGTLVQIRLSGAAALAGANPYGELGEEPNLIGELIGALAWWLATGDNDTEALEEGCGLVFYEPIPPTQIEAMIPVFDDDLWPHYDNRER